MFVPRRIPALLAVSAAAVAIPLAAAMPAPAATTVKPVPIYGTVGPGFTITLKNAKGAKVTKLKAGKSYVFVVKDKSKIHNFHLKGPGFNKKTAVDEIETYRWKIKPKAGTWTYQCDPHKAQLHGSFKVA